MIFQMDFEDVGSRSKFEEADSSKPLVGATTKLRSPLCFILLTTTINTEQKSGGTHHFFIFCY